MPAVDIKVAVNTAKTYLADMAPLLGTNVGDPRLEEVELSEDQNFWLITLSFSHRVEDDPFLDNQYQRDYKLFRVNASTGKVESMKIRAL